MRKIYKILLFSLLCLALIGCDRATKNLAKEHLQNKEPLSYFNDTLRFEYVENTGAFLSLGTDWPQSVSFWVLIVVPFFFCLHI